MNSSRYPGRARPHGRHSRPTPPDPPPPPYVCRVCGLQEDRPSDPGVVAAADVSHDVAIGRRADDAAHVVFGCETSVRGEVVLARWSLFGAEDGIQIYLRGLRSKETRFLFVDFFRRVRPAMLLLAAFDGMRALIRSISLRKRWPSFNWENYADRPLAEICSDFKIRVL